MDALEPLWTRLDSISRGLLAALPALGIAIIVAVVFFVVARLVRGTARRIAMRGGRSSGVGFVIGRLAQATLVILGILIAATIVFPSFAMGDLVEMLGITSVALGFAFRDILQNFLAGVLILWTRPFVIHDQIVYKDFEGTVTDIQTRATFIETYDGRRVVIPNAELFTNAVTVNTANEIRRIEHDVGVGVSDDLDLARAVIMKALAATPGVLPDPAPDCRVVDLGDFAIKLRVRWWISPPRRADLVEARDAVLSRVKNDLVAAGIDLPFPTTQVLFHDQTEESDGDRRRQREGWPAGSHVPKSARAAAAERDDHDGPT